MSRYRELWSEKRTFDLSDRLGDQATLRLEDLVERAEPLLMAQEALGQPVSWSPAEDRAVSLRELIAAHYPATARRFSLEPLPPGTSPAPVTRLSDQEFVKVAAARMDHGIHDFEDLPGVVFAGYPIQLLRNELDLETTQGARIVGMVAQRLALLETRLAADRLHLLEAPTGSNDASGGGD